MKDKKKENDIENWIEDYKKCGCSSGAKRKKDLLGYCKIHGNDRNCLYGPLKNWTRGKR